MATPQNDMAQMATARANMYGILADVFQEEPSEAFLSELKGPEFAGALKALNLSLDEMYENITIAELVEDLSLEFTRLFIGPGPHISANESMHVNARFGEPNAYWSQQTVDVKKFMQAVGLTLNESFSGMPDHLSAEFEFMQQLLIKEAEAWKAEQHELGSNILKIEKRFYDEHLSQWVGNFCDKIHDASRHPFYTRFSEVTKGFIDFEHETLQELIADVEIEDKLLA